jgi:DNA polymerase-1
MGRRLVFDIETNGLRRQVTKTHLLVIRDIDTDEEFVFRNRLDAELHAQEGAEPCTGFIEDGLHMLMEAGLIVGHNVVDFDVPTLEDLYPWFSVGGLIRDTLILTRLIFSNIKEDDFPRFRKGTLPGKLIGSQSLKAWGYRLGVNKLDFGDSEGIDAWGMWSLKMETYGRQDVVVSAALWKYIERQIARMNYSDEAIRLEHQFANLVAQIEHNGFPFHEADAGVLYTHLTQEKQAIIARLLGQFRPWWKAEKWKKDARDKPMAWREAEITTPTKTLNYKDPLKASRTEGAPFCPVKLEEFNPGSRDQIADRLQRLYGWTPKEFTETGKPKVSEDILRDLVGILDKDDEDGEADSDLAAVLETEDQLYEALVKQVPKAKDLADYFLIQKRIGQLAEGKNGWLKLVVNGKVHGSVNSLGAVTRRVTHAKPNMSQCPAIRSPYGVEMRKLWHVPDGWLQFGTDLSGIEIRCFADVLAEYDEGAYANIVINGDVHSENQRIFGVPTRDNAKTTLYALLYGAGDAKLGAIVAQGADAGRNIKSNFMQGVPAYRKVVRALTKRVNKDGWIPALDGGRLHVRSPHKALNTSLQSAGALVAKKWGVVLEERLLALGLEHGWDGDFAFLVMAHDEYQIAVRAPGVDVSEYENDTDYDGWDAKKASKHKAQHLQDWYFAQSPEIRLIAEQTKLAIKDVERHFEFLCPLDCEFKVGLNWADCH